MYKRTHLQRHNPSIQAVSAIIKSPFSGAFCPDNLVFKEQTNPDLARMRIVDDIHFADCPGAQDICAATPRSNTPQTLWHVRCAAALLLPDVALTEGAQKTVVKAYSIGLASARCQPTSTFVLAGAFAVASHREHLLYPAPIPVEQGSFGKLPILFPGTANLKHPLSQKRTAKR